MSDNFLDKQFSPNPCLSDYKALVLLMSQGWSPCFSLSSYGNDMRLSLSHMAWHKSLCSVKWSVSLNTGADVSSSLRKTLIDAFPFNQALWTDYHNTVPYILNRETNEIVINTKETELLADYWAGKRNVRWPERMTPRYLLPGWPGLSSVTEYMEKEQESYPDTIIQESINFIECLRKNLPDVKIIINLSAYPAVDGHWDWRYRVYISSWGRKYRQSPEQRDLYSFCLREDGYQEKVIRELILQCHQKVEADSLILGQDIHYENILMVREGYHDDEP